MRFKLGQEITPRNDKFYVVFGSHLPEDKIPKFGKVYTVALYPFGDEPNHPKHKFLLLAELPDALFYENSFEPLVTSDQLEDDLWEIQMLGERLADG